MVRRVLRPMRLAVRLEVTAGTGAIRCRAVAFFMHMKTVHAVWWKTGDRRAHSNHAALLREFNRAADLVVAKRF